LFVSENPTLEELDKTAPVLGLGNTGARGFMPHSDNNQVAIGLKIEASKKGL